MAEPRLALVAPSRGGGGCADRVGSVALTSSGEHGVEILEREAHLLLEVRFGRTVAACADLAGHEEQVA